MSISCTYNIKIMVSKIFQLIHPINLFIIGVLSFILVCEGFYSAPSNYSVVVYPHIELPGEPPDTSFVWSPVNSSGLSAGDTFFIDGTTIRRKSEYYDTDLWRNTDYIDIDPVVYFDVATGDTFHVAVVDTTDSNEIFIPLFNTKSIHLVYADTLIYKGTVSKINYTFSAVKASKGYIALTESERDASNLAYPTSREYSNTFHSTQNGIFLCYCIDAPDTLTLSVDSVSWSYLLDIDGSDTLWKLNRFVLEGKSNAFKIIVKSYSTSAFIVNDTGGFLIRDQSFPSNYNTDKYNNGEHYNLSYDFVLQEVGYTDIVSLVLSGFAGPDPVLSLHCPK